MTFRTSSLGIALCCAGVVAHGQTVAPTNSAPNPYGTVAGWATLPDGRTWGSTSAVDIDRDGVSVWVGERCSANNCSGSNLAPVIKFDSTGRAVKWFGAGMIQAPHAITVDKDGNVWVVDCACTKPAAGIAVDTTKGHQIYKFSPDGKLLMILGKPGGGHGSEYFWQPNDVVVAPNGNIFVAEGHSSTPTSTARIYKFSSDGKLLKTWGQWGKGPDDLDQPHTLAMDSRGRLFVGDRGNDRIVIYDQDGRKLDTWYQFSRPSGIAIDSRDRIYVGDSESESVSKGHVGWKRGIRIGSAIDGSITSFIPDPSENPPSTSGAEGVAVDARGNVYGAEVGQKALKKYVPKMQVAPDLRSGKAERLPLSFRAPRGISQPRLTAAGRLLACVSE